MNFFFLAIDCRRICSTGSETVVRVGSNPLEMSRQLMLQAILPPPIKQILQFTAVAITVFCHLPDYRMGKLNLVATLLPHNMELGQPKSLSIVTALSITLSKTNI